MRRPEHRHCWAYSSESFAMDRLIGETILEMHLLDSGEDMLFVCMSGRELLYRATGDCGSQSWFESILGQTQLLGSEVKAVEEIEMSGVPGFVPCVENRESRESKPVLPCSQHSGVEHESIVYYGIRITTGKGVAVVDYRNDSNGYYGGRCDLIYDSQFVCEEDAKPA